ncbi:MAG: AAA family ATPase [Planctomycetaceae bacterium]|nr:AAA family ATPase [Planctomycetaceae bacterium]MCB9951635.1 AAA family ATPase [Planctomycetaceae bacterium]
MTLDPNSPWAIAQGAQPTVPAISHRDVGQLCSYWIRNRALFQQVRPLLTEIHFGPLIQFQFVFTALCVAERQYGTWNERILCDIITDQAVSTSETLLEGQLELLTSPFEGGFIHDAVTAGQLSHVEMDHAVQLQERFLREKTVYLPLRNYVNPSRVGNQTRPDNVSEFLESLVRQESSISSLVATNPRSVLDLWGDHEDRLDQLRGRHMVGLETGLPTLDRSLLGLRGVTLLGAAPGAGKTVLCLQLSHGVCTHSHTNNAIVVFFSLELSRDELLTRLKCHLTHTSWKDYVRGGEAMNGEFAFTEAMATARDEAFTLLRDRDIGRRLYIVDREDIRHHSAETFARIVNNCRQSVGAEKVLVVIDYLQLLELSPSNGTKSDLDADKARFRMIQQIAEQTRTPGNLFSSAVIAISEARKPVGDSRKSQLWGTEMADLMGTSRLGYGADAVLMMRRMSGDDLNVYYGETSETSEARVDRFRSQGVAPLVLSIGKGRDGMSLCEIPLEFFFWRSTMRELTRGSHREVSLPVRPHRRPRVSTAPQGAST